MTYLEIYNKLAVVEDMPRWYRIKLTLRIAYCSSAIIEEIVRYLDTQEQPEYLLRLSFVDPKTKEPKESVISCQDVQEKLLLQPLPALLYMDWLRRHPRQAAALLMVRKDNLPQMPIEKLRARIDPALLAKADKMRNKQEQEDLQVIENMEK